MFDNFTQGFMILYQSIAVFSLQLCPEGMFKVSRILAHIIPIWYYNLNITRFISQIFHLKSVLKKKIMRGESTEEEKEAELTRSHKELIKDIVPTIKRLMQNKALVFLLCGEAMSNIFLSSMPFDTKLYSLLFK